MPRIASGRAAGRRWLPRCCLWTVSMVTWPRRGAAMARLSGTAGCLASGAGECGRVVELNGMPGKRLPRMLFVRLFPMLRFMPRYLFSRGMRRSCGCRSPGLASGSMAAGASALRVRLTRAGGDGVAVTVADRSGELVATVDALALRALALGESETRKAQDGLFGLSGACPGSEGRPHGGRTRVCRLAIPVARCAVGAAPGRVSA